MRSQKNSIVGVNDEVNDDVNFQDDFHVIKRTFMSV